ncbi:pyridoxamine 5'-phosphate oxidase family protein [Kribbella sp. NBC_01245]|uniref:pyridoxamine 5'-phosphate oxidase family protein n=1 Tax=Kribbella sp. NBC_01245 TaxID=2903578 RepID=UPI002E2B70B8|nr:pyridoxamine 5'-phosphate oxidase family protein [Kribbella sp. NBC_01245]
MADALAELQDRTFSRATAATAKSYPPERRLTAEQLTSYLSRREYAVIGSTRPDGRPHASMSMYIRSGSAFWLPTMAGSVRAINLRTQPWLTLVVAENDDDTHIAVIAEGPAEVVPLDDLPGDVRAVVDRQYAYVWKWVDAWIWVKTERVLSYAAEAAQP